MSSKIQPGDRITAAGRSFVVGSVLYQDWYGARSDAGPGSDCWGYDVEFKDTKGAYHHWKQNQDGGHAERWNGRAWCLLDE